jgi:glutamate-ammonia-ligase adenylyltransferase
MEVEFVAQVLQLAHAGAHPEVVHTSTRVALGRLREAGLLTAGDAGLLILADHVWRTVQGLLRITYGRAPAAKLSEAAEATLLAAISACGIDPVPVDADGLRATLERLAQDVRAAFVRHVGEIEP